MGVEQGGIAISGHSLPEPHPRTGKKSKLAVRDMPYPNSTLPLEQQLMLLSRRESTLSAYDRNYGLYLKCCEEAVPILEPSPLSFKNISHFINTQFRRGLAANTIRVYMSAVFTNAKDLHDDHVSDGLMRKSSSMILGVERFQQRSAKPAALAPMVHSSTILEMVELLNQLCASPLTVEVIPNITALALCVWGFAFCLRADSIVHILRGDVSITPCQIQLTVSTFKSKGLQQPKLMSMPTNCRLGKVLKSFCGSIRRL